MNDIAGPSAQSSVCITSLNSGEFNIVAKRIAAEEARPVTDRRGIARLIAGAGQPLAHCIHVVHLHAEMPARSILQRLLGKEMQLHVLPDVVPDQIEVLDRRRHWLLLQAQQLAVERARLRVAARRPRDADMLDAWSFHLLLLRLGIRNSGLGMNTVHLETRIPNSQFLHSFAKLAV